MIHQFPILSGLSKSTLANKGAGWLAGLFWKSLTALTRLESFVLGVDGSAPFCVAVLDGAACADEVGIKGGAIRVGASSSWTNSSNWAAALSACCACAR